MAKQLNSASAQVNMVFTADASQAKAEIAGLQKDLTSLTTNSFKNMGINSQVSKAVSEVTRLKAILTDATGETGKLDLSKFTKSLSQSGMSIGSIANSLNSLGGSGQAAFAKLASSILKAEVPLKQTSNLITEMKNTLVNSARWTIASSAIKGISSGISDAYQYAQDLNKSLTDIRIVSGKSADDMARFAIEANKAAKALNTTTGRYADASLIYYQQGLGEAAVKERTDITTKMANVTGQSAEAVSSQLTAVWNNFDNGSKSLEYFADVMVKLGAYTASSSDEISTGLQKFAPIAKTVGLSYEYAASALATLTATTRESADTVGTALKGIFSRLQGLKLGETLEDGTDLNKYTKALATVGVDVKNANGELKDMDTILDEIAAKWDTLGRAQQVALANTVGGTQRYTQFMSLMNNWDYMQELVGVSKSSEGTLDAQAQIYAESWDAATAKVRASLEGLWKNLINEDFFIGATNALGDLIDKITVLSTGLGGLPVILSLVANSLMKTFGPEIATSINNMADNFMATSEFGKAKTLGDKMYSVNKLVDMTKNARNIGMSEKQSSLMGYEAQQRMTKTIAMNSDKWNETQRDQAGGLLDNVVNATNAAKEAGSDKDWTNAKNAVNANRRINQLDHFKKGLDDDAQKQIDAADAELTQPGASRHWKKPANQDKYRALKRQKKEAQEIKNTNAQDFRDLKTTMDASYANADVVGRTSPLSTRLMISGKDEKEYGTILDDLNNILGDKSNDTRYSAEAQKILKDIRQVIENKNKDEVEQLQNLLTNLQTEANDSAQKSNEDYGKFASRMGMSEEEINEQIEQMDKEREEQFNKSSSWSQKTSEERSIIRSSEGSLENLGVDSTATIGEAYASVGQAISGATQALFGFKGALDALKNEDLSFADKLVAAMGGVTEGLSGAKDMWSGLKDARENFSNLNLKGGREGLAQVSHLVGGDQGQIGQVTSLLTNWDRNNTNYGDLAQQINNITNASLNATQAQNLLNNATGMTNAAFLAQVGHIAAVIAIIAAVIAVIYLLAKAYDDQRNSAEKNFEVQSQKLQQLQSDYSSLTEAVNTFKSTASNYSDCVAALEELEQGTLAYREAVLSANEAAQELLNQYPGLDYSVGSNGLIQIDKEAIEGAQNNLISQQEVAASAVHLQQAKVRDAQTAVDIEDVFNTTYDNWGDKSFGWYLTAPETLKELFAKVFTGGDLSLKDLVNENHEIRSADEITTKLKEYGGAYDASTSQGWAAMPTGWADSLGSLLNTVDPATLANLFNGVDLAQQQKQNDYQLAATGRFTQEELYGDEKDAALIPEEIKASYAAAVGEAYANKADLIPDLTTKELKDYAQNEYAKKMGYDTSQIKTIKDDDGNISYQFSDKNGQLIAGSEVSAAYLQNLYKNDQIDANPEKLMNGQSAQGYWRGQILNQVDQTEETAAFRAGVQKATGATVEDTDNAQLQQYADLFTQFHDSSSEKDFGEFLEKINELKLTEPEEAITQLQQIAQEFNLSPVYDEILRLLGLNDEASNTETPKSTYNTYKGIEDAVSGVGDTITQEQYDKMKEDGLNPDQWFKEGLDGEYTFTSPDVEGFQETMRDQAISGYEDAVANYEQTANDFSAMNGNGVTLEGLRGENGESASWDDKITALGDLNDGTYDELLNRLETDDAVGRGHSQEDMKAVTEAIQELTEGYENLDDIIDETTTKSGDLQDALDFEEVREKADEAGLSMDDVAEAAAALQEEFNKIDDENPLSDIDALRLAEEMLAAAQAADTISENVGDWGDEQERLNSIMNKTDKDLRDQDKLLDKVGRNMQNYLRTAQKIPKEVSKWALESGKLEKAVNGDVDAYYDLQAASMAAMTAEDKKINVYGKSFNTVDEYIEGMSDDMQKINDMAQNMHLLPGADIMAQDAASLRGQLENFINTYAETTDQAQQMLAQQGYDVTVVESGKREYTDVYSHQAYEEEIQRFGPMGMLFWVDSVPSVPDIVQEKKDIQPPPAFKIQSGKYTGGGNIGTKQGGGGGGGGNKGAKPKTPKAHKKSDISKRYNTTKQKIEKAEGDKDRIAKNKERAFGKEKIKQAEEEIVLQQKKLKYQTEYAKEVQEFLKEDSEALDKYAKEFNSKWAKSFANTPLAEGIHLEINKDGIIENFQEIEDALLAGENKIIDMENAMGGESTVEMDLMQRAIDDMREYIDRYETTLQLYEEVMNQMWEDADELDKLFLELTNIKVELKVDVTEDKLSFLEYLLGKIEEDTYKVADAMSYLGQSANASMDKIVAYREGIDEIFRRRFQGVGKEDLLSKFYDGSITLSDMINPDTGALDLGFTQDDIEQIRDYRDGLIEAMEALNELRTTELDKLTESLETFNEQLEGQTSVLESHVSILEAYRDIVDLIGTHNISQGKALLSQINQGRMGALRVQLSESKNVYEALLTQRDEYQKALNDVMDTGNEDAIHEWQKRLADIEEIVNDAKDNFLSNFQDALDAAVDILESSVELAADDFDKMLSPLYSTIDALQDAYDRQETVDNDYVQDYEKYYALAKDIRTLDEMLDDTDSIAAKNRLLKLQQEIVAQKAEDVKLSQYDLDVLEKRIELEKARIALEDAENDKTTVTLNRDSEGNWGYVYSTDEENVREKEQEYEDKLKEYQDLNKDYIDDLQSQIVDFEADTRDALSEIWEDTTLSEIEKLAQTEQIQQTALAHIRALTEQMSKATENQASTYELAVDRYQQSNMDLIDSFKETRLSELTGFKDTNEVLNTFTTSLDAYITQLTALQKTYDASVDAITKDAATEDWLREIITDIAGINAGSVDISENIRTLSKDMSDTFSAGAQAAATFEETYANVISNMVDENEKFIASLTNMIALLAKLNEANPEWQNLWDEFNSHKELVNAGEVSEKEWDAWYEDWADRVDDWIDSLKATGSYNEATDVALEDMAGSITLAASNMIKANADAASGNTNLQAPTMTDNSTTNNTTTNNNYYINGTVVDPTAIVADFIEETFDESSIDA